MLTTMSIKGTDSKIGASSSSLEGDSKNSST